jgi:hypothetical protein
MKVKAIKGNKVYTITETEKNYYKVNGFDITDDDENVLEHGSGKNISYDKYQTLKGEYQALKTEFEQLKAKMSEDLGKTKKKDV